MKKKFLKKTTLFFTMLAFLFALNINVKASEATIKVVQDVNDLKTALENSKAGTTILLEDGYYNDAKLDIKSSGEENKLITIKAQNPGQAIFTGDSNIAVWGNFVVLEGLYFKDGNRNPKEWKTHGPGLISIYGDHNRVTQCAVHNFDTVNTAWVTTSINKSTGHVPQYNRIDHCSFTGKVANDQVINLNNSLDKKGQGTPMYNRVDHCYFSNPKKKGNAGGAIRVGYFIHDTGRCLIDNNLFERQDSEAEIITSKSKENIYLNNTIRNCQGTLNFRHGSDQVAIGNYFIGNDEKYGYGGMFVWGANHVIANNYFSLSRTLKDRGFAAIYLNPGVPESEHSLAYNVTIANNIFANNQSHAIHLDPLYDRRIDAEPNTQHPHDNKIINNIFYSEGKTYSAFKNDFQDEQRNDKLENNIASGLEDGYGNVQSVENKDFSMYMEDGIYKMNSESLNSENQSRFTVRQFEGIENIPGLDFELNLDKLAHKSIYDSKPLNFKDVAPSWMDEIPR